MLTFFCSLTTLVHFLSRSFSYCLVVRMSKVSSVRSSSLRSAAAVCERLFEDRYAMMALWLECRLANVPVIKFAVTYSSSAWRGDSAALIADNAGALGTEPLMRRQVLIAEHESFSTCLISTVSRILHTTEVFEWPGVNGEGVSKECGVLLKVGIC